MEFILPLDDLTGKETAITKATISADDDLAGNDDGGHLNPEQQREFFIRVRNQMKMNMHSRIVPMTGTGIEIPQLDISGRVLERDRNQVSRKRSIDTEDIKLYGKRVKAAFRVTQSFIEENVEEENGIDSLVDAFSRKVANGLENLLFLSNTLGHAILQSEYNNDRDDVGSTTNYIVDDLYNMFDGMIKTAVDSGNVLDAANSTDIRRLVTIAKKGLPARYREDVGSLRIYMPIDLVENLRYALSTRETVGGDISVNEHNMLTICGIQVVGLPLLSNNPKFVDHVTLAGSTPAPLTFANIDQDDVIVTAQTLGSTPTAAATITTDYTVNEANGTVTRAAGLSDPYDAKVTYEAPPLFILTIAENVIFGVNEDFRIGYDYELDTDTTLVVIRTRIDFRYQENQAVVLVKNVQDALPTSKPL